MGMMDELKDLDAEIKAENAPKINDDVDTEQTPSKDQIVENRPIAAQNMTQEQANAIVDAAKNPRDFIGVKVSSKINELIENNDDVKEKIADIAEDTTMTGIETFSTTNKKQRKANYFELNEKDIAPMGGDKTSSKGQQVSIVVLRRFFWMIIMATLGFFYIAPLTVMVELFQGLTFKKIEKEEIAINGEKKTKQYITRTKLGRAGSILGFVFGLILDVAVGIGNYFFPFVYLIISAVVFTVLVIINFACAFDFRTLRQKKESSSMVIEDDNNG